MNSSLLKYFAAFIFSIAVVASNATATVRKVLTYGENYRYYEFTDYTGQARVTGSGGLRLYMVDVPDYQQFEVTSESGFLIVASCNPNIIEPAVYILQNYLAYCTGVDNALYWAQVNNCYFTVAPAYNSLPGVFPTYNFTGGAETDVNPKAYTFSYSTNTYFY